MHRIDHDTKSDNLFGAGKDGFTEGDVGGGIPPTIVTHDWLNDVQEALCTVIESAGLTLAKGTNTQLLSAILNLASVRNKIDGFIMSVDGSDSEHDINFAIGSAADSSNTYVINSSSSYLKQIDGQWSEGSGVGGFPSAGVSGLTLTADTWYGCFVIGKSSDPTAFDFGWDENLDASVLLNADNAGDEGYDIYRRVGYIKTDGSFNIVPFLQKSDKFFWDVPVVDLHESANTTSAKTTSLTVPPDSNVFADIFWRFYEDSGGASTLYGLITSPDQTDTAPSASAYSMHVIDSTSLDQMQMSMLMPVNSSGQVRTRWSGASAGEEESIITRGWVDPRGKQ